MQPPLALHDVRSRYGLWRDLLPIYSWLQLIWCVGILIVIVGAIAALGVDHLSPVLIGGTAGMLAVSYQSRPVEMEISLEESQLVEKALQTEGRYARSSDGLWRLIKSRWWSTWPHYTIEINRHKSMATVVAPKPTMKRINGLLLTQGKNLAH